MTHEDSVTAAVVPEATVGSRLEVLAGQCASGTCPTVYRRDAATAVVQGYEVSGADAGVELPDGEHLVEIPIEVLLAAADKIRNQA